MARRLVECIAQWPCGPVDTLAHAPASACWAASDGQILHLFCDDVHAASLPVPCRTEGTLNFEAGAGTRVLLAPHVFDVSQRRWQAPSRTTVEDVGGASDVACMAAWSADGELLVEATRVRHDCLVASSADVPDGVLLDAGKHAAAIRAIAVGRCYIVAGGLALSVWQRDGLRHVADLEAHSLGILGLAYAHDDALLASVGADGTLAVWDAESWSLLAARTVTDDGLSAVAVHPREPIIATGGADGVLRLHGLDAAPLHEEAFDAPLTALAYAPAGDRLIAALGGATPRLLWLRLL